MKAIKVLALILTVFAFPVSGGAMAESTALCKFDPGFGANVVCPEGEAYTTIHFASPSSPKIKLLSNIITVECNLLFLGETLEELAEPLEFEGELTYTGCNNSCVVSELGGPSLMKFLKEGGETAVVTMEGELHVGCPALSCNYNWEGLEGIAKGPLSTGQVFEITAEEKTLTQVSGTFCPKEAKLDLLLRRSANVWIKN